MNPLSPEIYRWLVAVHVIGVILWAGGLVACTLALGSAGRSAAVGDPSAAQSVGNAVRSSARAMDIGAAIAMVVGVLLILGAVPSPMKSPWMHVKMTLVLGLLGLHGFTQAKLKRFRLGTSTTFPSVVFWISLGLVAGIVLMVVAKPIG